MNIQLSDHFNYRKLLRFALPSVIMMIFTSIYGVVDGIFVSNFVGKTPFAAVNFIMPVLMILGGLGFMFGSGGSALIAKLMGEGEKEKANSVFTLLVIATAVLSVVLLIPAIIFLPQIAKALGGEGDMLSDAVLYGRIILASLPFFMIQFEFQSFFVTAEKPTFGLWATVATGVCNMIFDFLFMAVFKWGIIGAALATALSQTVGGIIPLIYFSRKNSSLLRFTKTAFDGKALLKTCTNGSSELMGNISMSIVSMLYNLQLLKYAGEDGVAAYGVLMYINFIFLAIFIGYSVGTAPIISYHFGAGNKDELKSLRKKSTVIILISSVVMLVLSEVLAYPLSYIFVSYDASLMEMTLRGFLIYSFSFLFAGFAIFGSGFFTALNDGLTSAVISFLRTLLFQVAAVLIMPILFDLDGIWASIVVAEVMAVIITVIFMIAKRKKYGY